LRRLGGAAGVWLAVWTFTSIGEAAPPEDPVGSWKLSCVCPDGQSRDCVIAISRHGESLKATYTSNGVTRAARSVAFEGGILTVRVDGEFGGSRYVLTYEGRPSGDTLRGDIRWSYLWASGSFAFRGERIVEDDFAAR
jgi:hypothetical protein